METGNEVFNEIFGHKLTDTRDKARIDDLGRQTVVDGGTVPRFRSTLTTDQNPTVRGSPPIPLGS
jgi:hypothetical protein